MQQFQKLVVLKITTFTNATTMKYTSIFVAWAIVAASCTLAPGIDEDLLSEGNIQANTGIEGEWTWIGTTGEGVAGPHQSDSVSAGYTWRLTFIKSEGNAGEVRYVKMFKSGQKEECTGSYSYTIEPDSHTLDLACTSWLNNNRWESYRWEIRTLETAVHLYLRNVEDCCDNTFEHHFLRTSTNQ